MKSIIGAVIGDVVGSIYETYEYQNKQIDLSHRLSIFKKDKDVFESGMSFTDDSVLTGAIADAILQGQTYESRLREFGLKEENLGLDMYGRSRFGANFLKWLHGLALEAQRYIPSEYMNIINAFDEKYCK